MKKTNLFWLIDLDIFVEQSFQFWKIVAEMDLSFFKNLQKLNEFLTVNICLKVNI